MGKIVALCEYWIQARKEVLYYLLILCLKKCLRTYEIIENQGFMPSGIQTGTSAVQNYDSFPNWHLAVEQ